ncbi:hypothetical protein Tco_0083466 [Tanacetum coccineum]
MGGGDINTSSGAYADADHAGCQDTRRSTSGSAQFLDVNLLSRLPRSKRALRYRVALDNALVAPKSRVQIGKCNIRIDPIKTPKEPTYQVVLDSLALSPLYLVFLITAEVSEIYMQQFLHTITKIKNSSSYKFKLDNKKCTIDVEVFRDILQNLSKTFELRV